LNDSTDDDVTKWIIGLTYTTQNRKDFNGVLPKIWLTENKTILTDQDGTGWYIFNLQSIGKVYKQQLLSVLNIFSTCKINTTVFFLNEN